MAHKYVTRVCLYLMAANAMLSAETYSLTKLNPTSDLKGNSTVYTAALGLNDLDQVVGIEATTSPSQAFAVVWTKGAATKLPVPAGYAIADGFPWFITNTGEVMGALTTETYPYYPALAVWQATGPDTWSAATMLEGPSGCQNTPATGSVGYGINKAGLIVGTSGVYGADCSAAWFWDGSQFSALAYPVPPGCNGDLFVTSINDANEISGYFSPTGGPCPDPGTDYYPFIYTAAGGYTTLPSPTGVPGWQTTKINNQGDVLGFNGPVVFWSSTGAQNLGSGGWAGMNDLGQVSFYAGQSGLEGDQAEIWRNGTATPVNLPSGASGPFQFLNNAGQLASAPSFNGGSNPALLLTPRRACASNVTSQVEITAGSLEFNSSTLRYDQTFTLTNAGSDTLGSPISLVFDGLPATATLYGIVGSTLCGTVGSGYVSLAKSLDPGDSAKVDVQFIDASGAPITYTNQVIAGSGGR